MSGTDHYAAHGTAGLLEFRLWKVHVAGTVDLFAHYAPADENGRVWTATYGPFSSVGDAEEFARNLPRPGDRELGPLVEIGRGNGWSEYAIYPEDDAAEAHP